ncbi:hypothetical protein NVV94_26110 [Pseudomonas sp. LS1212]|uniref:hypothetical protein n=1 Tax=Pseudomonas sp. LS1212 TaxID=2972478 RepID=UPI00215CA0F4|nr:hypothetical protein [Pseudomonas sp. LS1212]UVJ43948.1 hypothetical protein NVV94_26110 [Pseudomonas sp. LS1212]
MRYALALSLLAALLSGCASHANRDVNGVWINQNAIDAAAKGVNLRQALLANGPNFEWRVNVPAAQATFSNGFELGDGTLKADGDQWKVDFYGNYEESLTLDDDELIQAATESGQEQSFQRPKNPAPAGAPPGASFEQALYAAYLGGDWKIAEGPGEGAVVRFQSDGRIEGLPNTDRYALCLAGDCAAMSGEFDSLWLEQNKQGNPWIFVRQGDQLEILQAVNQAKADEMPDLHPGTRRWLLEKE